jgi:hypothetical protein
LQIVSGDFRPVHYTACAKSRIAFSDDIDIAHIRLIKGDKPMPLPTVHSLSTAVAGFVIAAYWLIYVVVIGLESAYPATFELSPREARGEQVCEREASHNQIVQGVVGSCGSIDSGEATLKSEADGDGTL